MDLVCCCRDLFLIMDMENLLGEAVGLIIKYTTMDMSINEDNAI